MKLFGAATLL